MAAEKTPHVTYEFRHITDLLNVPADRLGVCLDELKLVIPAMNLTRVTAQATGDPRAAHNMFPVIRWEDNGDNVVTINCGAGSSFSVRSSTKPMPPDPKTDDPVD